ncbi:MAG: DUF692 domain-containing protein [Anaerolineae bacterium]|nr:DUF692 domain-containing protein [Anaerolineae bacterium]
MTQSNNAVAAIPYLGSGMGFRRSMKQAIFDARDSIDFVEIITDQYAEGDPRYMRELEEASDIFQVIPHGIGLSIGSAGPLSRDYLRAIKHISDLTRSPYYSEHLCMTQAPGINIGHLSPLWFTEPVLENTINRVAQVQNYLGKPLILENVTYAFDIPQAEMPQTEFFNRLVAATGCGVLLDITNVFINSTNHGYDPIAFLEEMPLDNVVQVHVAGGFWRDDVLIDGHSEPVQEESWGLLEQLAAKIKVRACILEHDSNFPESINPLVDQVNRARKIITGPALEQDQPMMAQAL